MESQNQAPALGPSSSKPFFYLDGVDGGGGDVDEDEDHDEHEGEHDELNSGGPFNQMKMTQLNCRQILFAGYHKNTGDIGFAAWEPEENHNTK